MRIVIFSVADGALRTVVDDLKFIQPDESYAEVSDDFRPEDWDAATLSEVRNAAVRLEERRAAIDARALAHFRAGFAPSHPDFANQRLQVRDVDDKTNWLTSEASYRTAIENGYGAVLDAEFRTASNARIKVSFDDGHAILMEMAAWGRAILQRTWTLKDAATSGEAIDLEAGWP